MIDLNTRILKVNEKDNVAIALNELRKGTHIQCDGETIELTATIPQKHKFTCKNNMILQKSIKIEDFVWCNSLPKMSKIVQNR